MSVEGVDAAAVHDAPDPDVGVDGVQGVRQQVAVGLRPERAGGESTQHNLRSGADALINPRSFPALASSAWDTQVFSSRSATRAVKTCLP